VGNGDMGNGDMGNGDVGGQRGILCTSYNMVNNKQPNRTLQTSRYSVNKTMKYHQLALQTSRYSVNKTMKYHQLADNCYWFKNVTQLKHTAVQLVINR